MDDGARETFKIMLGVKELPNELVVKYDKIKLLNDKVSGGRFPSGIMAIIASEFIDKKEDPKSEVSVKDLAQGTVVFTIDEEGKKRYAIFQHYINGGKYKGKVAIHYNDNKDCDNEIVSKEEIHMED